MSGFYVSFRARHSALDLIDLLAPLGIVPTHCWAAGEQRRTPKGVLLEGIYEGSYYCCDLPLPEVRDLAEWLERAIVFLRPISKQLIAFAHAGGSLSFYIGLEKGVFEGTTLDLKLLAKLVELRVSLEIDRDI